MVCIEEKLGLRAEASNVVGREKEGDIVVKHPDGTFAIELFRQSDAWWCQRPSEEQLKLFTRIADAAGFDVEYDGGVWRWNNGDFLDVRSPAPEPFRIRGIHVFFAVMALFSMYYVARQLL